MREEYILWRIRASAFSELILVLKDLVGFATFLSVAVGILCHMRYNQPFNEIFWFLQIYLSRLRQTNPCNNIYLTRLKQLLEWKLLISEHLFNVKQPLQWKLASWLGKYLFSQSWEKIRLNTHSFEFDFIIFTLVFTVFSILAK